MKTAIIQFRTDDQQSWKDRIAQAERILSELAQSEEKPDLILFPEIWCNGFFGYDTYHETAEPIARWIRERMSDFARRMGCYIHTGSFVEMEGDVCYNTALLLAPSGESVARYRKIHLFTYQSREPELMTGGHEISVVDTPFGKMGLAICYDLRFPELFREMSRQGAEYILICACWPEARVDHWVLLNQARAVENQAYVIACNGVGNQAGVELGGNSLVVEPRGAIAAQGDSHEAQVILVDLDREKVREYRENFSALRDRVL